METNLLKTDRPFQILEHLGNGDYGSVYLVQHYYLGAVAFKTIQDISEISLAELKAEAGIHRNLRHPHIVIFYAELFSSKINGIFIEHMKYGTVEQFLKQFDVSPEWRIQILYDTALAMCYLHGHELPVIHGSVSCQNILIGVGFRAKISDFGFACIPSKDYLETVTQASPTRFTKYIAPEYLCNPKKRKSVAFDIYSFAISAWEILSQKQAYSDFVGQERISEFVRHGRRPSLENLDTSISTTIVELIKVCWQEQENKRPKFDYIKDVLFDHISLSGMNSELKRSYSNLIEQDRERDNAKTMTVMLSTETQVDLAENKSAKATCEVFRSTKIQLVDVIGQGGHSTVYKAKFVKDGEFGINQSEREVAYKKFKVEYMPRDSVMADLEREAELNCKLNHRNIIKCLGMVRESGNFGLIIELAEYGEVRNYLIKNNYLKMKLTMIKHVALGMEYLHNFKPNPVIHGDLKIQNVLVGVGDDQKSSVAKLCDFGFSRLKEYSQSRSVNDVPFGTITHIPPEFLNDSCLRKNEKFDVYSFGICACEMITLERPFINAGNNPGIIQNWVLNGERPSFGIFESEVRREEGLIELIKSCWQRESTERPTFKYIVDKLSTYKTG